MTEVGRLQRRTNEVIAVRFMPGRRWFCVQLTNGELNIPIPGGPATLTVPMPCGGHLLAQEGDWVVGEEGGAPCQVFTDELMHQLFKSPDTPELDAFDDKPR